MADSVKEKRGFRWGRFAVTFLIIAAIFGLGHLASRKAEEPLPQGLLAVSSAAGQLFGILVLTFIVSGIDSLILRRRAKRLKNAAQAGQTPK